MTWHFHFKEKGIINFFDFYTTTLTLYKNEMIEKYFSKHKRVLVLIKSNNIRKISSL